MYCIVLYCVVLYFILLYCIVLYFIAFYFSQAGGLVPKRKIVQNSTAELHVKVIPYHCL